MGGAGEALQFYSTASSCALKTFSFLLGDWWQWLCSHFCSPLLLFLCTSFSISFLSSTLTCRNQSVMMETSSSTIVLCHSDLSPSGVHCFGTPLRLPPHTHLVWEGRKEGRNRVEQGQWRQLLVPCATALHVPPSHLWHAVPHCLPPPCL